MIFTLLQVWGTQSDIFASRRTHVDVWTNTNNLKNPNLMVFTIARTPCDLCSPIQHESYKMTPHYPVSYIVNIKCFYRERDRFGQICSRPIDHNKSNRLSYGGIWYPINVQWHWIYNMDGVLVLSLWTRITLLHPPLYMCVFSFWWLICCPKYFLSVNPKQIITCRIWWNFNIRWNVLS